MGHTIPRIVAALSRAIRPRCARICRFMYRNAGQKARCKVFFMFSIRAIYSLFRAIVQSVMRTCAPPCNATWARPAAGPPANCTVFARRSATPSPPNYTAPNSTPDVVGSAPGITSQQGRAHRTPRVSIGDQHSPGALPSTPRSARKRVPRVHRKRSRNPPTSTCKADHLSRSSAPTPRMTY